MGSHPTRMRGLKLVRLELTGLGLPVASYTDAWIEITLTRHAKQGLVVASYTDAWIEIEDSTNVL